MKITRILTPLAIAISAMMGAQQAAAASLDHHFVLRVGGSYADPDDADTRELRELLAMETFPERVDLESDVTWQISGVWMPVEHWGIELMYIGEADNDVDFKGSRPAGLPKRAATFKAETANAYVNWYPLDKSCLFQPYFGVGINYTHFTSERFSSGLNSYTDTNNITAGGFRMGLSHTWGATAQLGVDFKFGRDDSFLINAAVLYIDSSPDWNAYYTPGSALTPASTDTPANLRIDDLDYDPWVFNLGVGYAF